MSNQPPIYDLATTRPFGDAAYNEASVAANDYGVSLVHGDDLIGSATLVSVGEHHGLLTADHVWKAILEKEEREHAGHICLVFSKSAHRFEVPLDGISPVVVGEYSDSHAFEGPDITFLRLGDVTKLGELKAKKSFSPISLDALALFKAIPHDRCYWVIWGAPGELSLKGTNDLGEGLNRITHFVMPAEFGGIEDAGEYDYCTVEIPYGKENYPTTYGGVSGGGAWITYGVSEDPQGQMISGPRRLLLVGLAYFQRRKSEGVMELKLHGPKSIHKRVTEAVSAHFA